MSTMDLFLGDVIDDESKINRKTSIRTVVKKDGKYLMINARNGFLLIPGGGVEEGETFEEAGIRELREETGYSCVSEMRYLGKVITSRPDLFEDGRYYQMESVLYTCDVADEPGELEMTKAEIDFGCYPEWLTKDEILEQNRAFEKELGRRDVWCEMVERVLCFTEPGTW